MTASSNKSNFVIFYFVQTSRR